LIIVLVGHKALYSTGFLPRGQGVSMKEDESAKQGFIIKDRRRFDDAGQVREDEAELARPDDSARTVKPEERSRSTSPLLWSRLPPKG
jgi:hypothetical protein